MEQQLLIPQSRNFRTNKEGSTLQILFHQKLAKGVYGWQDECNQLREIWQFSSPWLAWVREITWCAFGNNMFTFFLQTMYGLLCLLHISHNERGFQKAMKQKIRIPNSDITLVLVEKRNWW